MPFYGAPGILVNGTQASALNISGPGAQVSGGNISINGFNVSNGSLSIDNPTQLNVSGTGQVLSITNSPVTVVHSGYGEAASAGVSTINITLSGAPTPGNLLILYGYSSNKTITPPSGFTSIGDGFYYRTVQQGDPTTWATFSVPGLGAAVAFLMEISGMGSMSGAIAQTGTVTDTTGAYSATVQTNAGYLYLAAFNAASTTNWSVTNLLPAGATALPEKSTIGGGASCEALMVAFDAAATSTTISFTNATDLGGASLNYVGIPYNPATVQANLAIT